MTRNVLKFTDIEIRQERTMKPCDAESNNSEYIKKNKEEERREREVECKNKITKTF